ncbi:MAG TPA: LysM peptidoglycan-binding domain-containing protein [Candidatus Dormibacteraeota bacterium]|nr:LysM peptidoglycan-binding domain-containing protein [Candidatus Dormibacteraeota bacterium]
MICDLTRPYTRRRHPWHRERRLALALVVAVALVILLGGLVRAGTSGVGSGHVTVAAGDTLWSIASDHATDGDIGAEVDAIMRSNGLSSPVIVPGEVLVIPAT